MSPFSSYAKIASSRSFPRPRPLAPSPPSLPRQRYVNSYEFQGPTSSTSQVPGQLRLCSETLKRKQANPNWETTTQERVRGSLHPLDRQRVWESRDEPQGAALSTRAWVSRSPSVPRATGAPGLRLHGLCVPSLRSAGWDDRLINSRLRGARTSPGWSSKSTVRRLFRSSRPQWEARPPKPEPPENRFSRWLVAPGAAGRPEKLPQVAGGEPAGPRPSPPLPSRHPLCGAPRTPGTPERVPPRPPPPPQWRPGGRPLASPDPRPVEPTRAGTSRICHAASPGPRARIGARSSVLSHLKQPLEKLRRCSSCRRRCRRGRYCVPSGRATASTSRLRAAPPPD